MARALTRFFLAFALFTQSLSGAQSPDGTTHVPAFDLPVSGLLSEETQALLKKRAQDGVQAKNPCPKLAEEFKDEVHARPCLLPGVSRMRARYAVSVQPGTVGGVGVETITPAEGVSAAHQQQVLINLHGGAFLFGARWIGQIESIPATSASTVARLAAC